MVSMAVSQFVAATIRTRAATLSRTPGQRHPGRDPAGGDGAWDGSAASGDRCRLPGRS